MKGIIRKVVYWGVFLAIFGAFSVKAIQSHLVTSDISSDAIEAIASITSIEEKTRIKKGREIKSYLVSFEYNAEGEVFTNTKSFSYENRPKSTSLSIVYSASDPSKFLTKRAFEAGWSIGKVIGAMVFALFLGGIISLFAGGMIVKLLGCESEEEPEAESSPGHEKA